MYAEIEQRFQQIKAMNTTFGFLTQVEYLRNASNAPGIDEAIDTLCDVYMYDEIISQDLKNEVHSFRRRLSSYEENNSKGSE